MNLKVTEVEHYTDRLFRIRTERPAAFRFTAGEFTMIGITNDNIKRAYSMTSGPHDEYLEFYSIKVPGGPLTSRLQHINVGDEIEVGTKTTGTLTLANLELGGDLWMLATGTGIAPFISLLRDPETYDHFDQIHVYWSVRTSAELQAYDSFLQEQGVKYTATVTQDPTWKGQNKRITKFITAGQVANDSNPSKHKVMICGGPDFNNDMSDMFKSRGFTEGTRKTRGSFVQERAFVDR